MTDDPIAAPSGAAPDGVPGAAPAAPPPATDTPPEPRRASLVPLLVLLDLVLVALAVGYVWRFPPTVTEARLAALEERVTALAARPSPPSSPSSPPSAEIAALATRLQGDESRLDALAKQQAALAAAENQPAPPAAPPAPDITALLARLHEDEARLDALTESSGAMSRQVAGVVDRTTRLARLQAAGDALAAGRPLGDLPGAPPALARFAATPPPTLATLRAAFPAAAAAARAAAAPPSLVPTSRLMDWIGAVMTIRRGDQVLVGDTLATRLAAARAALAGDDLAGALAALAPIEGAPAAALASWQSEAANLLAARRALADLVAAS
jgi:hypothetical protein